MDEIKELEEILKNECGITLSHEEFNGVASYLVNEKGYRRTPAQGKELDRELVCSLALEKGFIISTAHGQGVNKMMPVTDRATLMSFAEALLREFSAPAQSDKTEISAEEIQWLMNPTIEAVEQYHLDDEEFCEKFEKDMDNLAQAIATRLERKA